MSPVQSFLDDGKLNKAMVLALAHWRWLVKEQGHVNNQKIGEALELWRKQQLLQPQQQGPDSSFGFSVLKATTQP